MQFAELNLDQILKDKSSATGKNKGNETSAPAGGSKGKRDAKAQEKMTKQ